MLSKLSIRNYALIDSLELEFDSGLTIITGETGAGKSIMLGALSMIMGGRADSRVIADGGSKSVVEASFAFPPASLEQSFAENDLDWNAEELLIRREIASNGRSRVFINDVPVTLSVLASISGYLIDIHSQHENARLTSQTAQLEIIDSVSDNEKLRKRYAEAFRRFVEIRNRVKRIRQEQDRMRENREYLQFQYEGLKTLSPKRGELETIEKRFELLSDADEIRERLQYFRSLLGDNDRGALDLLRTAKAEADRVDYSLVGIETDEDTPAIPERLENVIVELQDMYETIDDAVLRVDADPAVLEKLSRRMNEYYDAVKQYRVKTADELVDMLEKIGSQLDVIETGGEELPMLEKEGKRVASEVKELAVRLTESREEGARRFSRVVTETARPLGLSNLDFSVNIAAGKMGPTGQDRVEFRCSFNKNQVAGPIAGMASGGEMSRLMLTIKRVLAGRMNLPTIIFDEIDTGVSGEIADKMGEMMVDMSRDMQVMAITHLPQVAAKGDSHFKVFKKDEETRTLTHVRRLDEEARVREIAAMMSGSEVGDAALNNARVLLGRKSGDKQE
ncbi:MAG: DNA repair protein RecN [Muribaculaceae bacterium]|jgi:DNA repair protein RecN (Recombination protein N)|uniref:DNA repair protein RecN n=1 Tax=Sangeribacter muris TaxID=2880703 RepID=UPI000FFEDA99|nr:DNA repair protein RecN [Sangeribacter muris]MCX4280849.1 DNA repair protein RecN [Muribaculaceae bacterium]RXE67841.1 DNA repair protein RecN [Muribaculaceae bacterium Isolate-001 (NCI)]